MAWLLAFEPNAALATMQLELPNAFLCQAALAQTQGTFAAERLTGTWSPGEQVLVHGNGNETVVGLRTARGWCLQQRAGEDAAAR